MGAEFIFRLGDLSLSPLFVNDKEKDHEQGFEELY